MINYVVSYSHIDNECTYVYNIFHPSFFFFGKGGWGGGFPCNYVTSCRFFAMVREVKLINVFFNDKITSIDLKDSDVYSLPCMLDHQAILLNDYACK